jgi:predicted RNase H-like nuclease (RuvC/YqgF family)
MRFAHRLFAVTMILSAAAYAQSLGDIARQNEQNKQNQPAATVITNDDLPADGLADEGAQPRHRNAARDDSGQQARAELQRAAKNDSAAQGWRTKILNQKSSIDSLQAHIQNVKASIRVPLDSSGYYAGQANQRTQAKVQEIDDLQQKLQIENQKLQDLQESARKAGFGSAVYEP